jgi:hypothetical protein
MRELENCILKYFAERRVASAAHLTSSLEVSEAEWTPALEAMESKGWVSRGEARFIDSPESAVTLFVIQPAGLRQIALRGFGGEYEEIVTRAELIDELDRRGVTTRDRLESDAYLSGYARFKFWPSLGAYLAQQHTD